MKSIYFLAILVIAASCSREDALCECIRTSETLSKKTTEVLNKSNIELSDKTELDTLRAHREEKCKDFSMMSGDQLRKKKETCKID